MNDILPTTPVPQWDSNDAKLLRELLTSDTFQKALRIILEDRPQLMDGTNVNCTLVRNGEVKGFDAALTSIFALTFEQPKPQITSENYPSLDDNSAWELQQTPQ